MAKQNKQPGIHLYKTKELVASGRSQPDIYEDRWYWILIAKNGKTIAKSSETYKRKASAVDSIRIAAKLFIGSMGLSGGHYFDHTGKEMKVDCFI